MNNNSLTNEVDKCFGGTGSWSHPNVITNTGVTGGNDPWNVDLIEFGFPSSLVASVRWKKGSKNENRGWRRCDLYLYVDEMATIKQSLLAAWSDNANGMKGNSLNIIICYTRTTYIGETSAYFSGIVESGRR
jgi:hypothetical protein